MTEDEFHKQNTLPGRNLEQDPSSKELDLSTVPEKIGPYYIESFLEKGGMSMLYLGIHPETKDSIAIKVLSPKFVSNPEMVERFLNEASIIGITDHPNIVKLYGQGEWEQGLYIAMEFIQGVSLLEFLNHHPMSLKKALETILEIAYALCHLHTHGVIHRDLKPENILLDENNVIKIIDFGIAQLISEMKGSSTFMGTPIYMSPEQRANPKDVSYPSDIYALGIIAYELITGKLSHGKIQLSLIPKGLQKILGKTLQPEAYNRYQDVVDFIGDISNYLESKTLLKERGVSDHLHELSEKLVETQLRLLPNKAPNWEKMTIGLAAHRGDKAPGIYYDFLKVSQNSYSIILAEPSIISIEEILYVSVLRGMVRSLSHLNAKPHELISTLNELLVKDSMDQMFTLSLLSLRPNDNQLEFISCGYSNLWYKSAESKNLKILKSKDLAIGIDLNTEYRAIKQSWHVGDLLVLNTFSAMKTEANKKLNFSEDLFESTLQENLYKPPQKIADTLLRKAKAHNKKGYQEHSLAVACISRTE